jgi:hypothetical protein
MNVKFNAKVVRSNYDDTFRDTFDEIFIGVNFTDDK